MGAYLSLLAFSIFILNILNTGANRWGWGGGGGSNRGNHFKPGGGFNSWRQQSFKHTNNHQYITQLIKNDDSFNNDHPAVISFNRKPDNRPDTNVPTVILTHVPAHTSCAIPTMGDSTKFELRCIFPNSDLDEDCAKEGSKVVPSGTSTTLRCKPPYISESGDIRIWACEDGIWKGEFKAFSCTHPPIQITGSNNFGSNNFFYNDNDNNANNQYQPDTDPKTPTNSWSQNIQPSQPSVTDLVSGLLPQTNKRPQLQKDEDEEDNLFEGSSVAQPPWSKFVEKWRPSSTTTKMTTTTTTPTTTTKPPTTTTRPTTTTIRTTTTTTTTPTPYIPPAPTESNGWKEYFDQRQEKEKNVVKCPSLRRRTGVQLECLSKSPVPWDPSSFLVSQSDCSAPQPVSTEATYKCEQYYEASVGLTIQYRKCKDDGTWTGGENRFSCALECGKSNPVGRIPLITNGEPTYKAQWPWHAALFYQDVRKSQTFEYNCGATLINRKVVLTAAHCVTEFYSKSVKGVAQFRVDLGRYERTVEDEYVQTFFAEDIIPHPSYNPISYDSDIAIIILKGKASVGFHVRPICYPQTQNSAFEELHLSDGSYGTVVGFGKNEAGDLSDILHMAKLKVVSQQECAESFADTNFGASLTKSTTFCAGLKNGTNVCSGDSGGGIYFPVSSGGVSRWYLQGLVSVGITSQDGSNRCDPTRFSVFTRISPYADWIVRVLSERDAL